MLDSSIIVWEKTVCLNSSDLAINIKKNGANFNITVSANSLPKNDYFICSFMIAYH